MPEPRILRLPLTRTAPPASPPLPPPAPLRRVSVVIPARNAADSIGRTVGIVFDQAPRGVELEVLVVDDGSTDETAALACAAGARALLLGSRVPGGSPGAARNRGFAASTGDPVIFLDVECTPSPGWLKALLAAHDAGEAVVGGALALPAGLPWTGRCEYYANAGDIHPGRPAAHVPHHPPANLSVRRGAFLTTHGFSEELPDGDGREERSWQAELARRGVPVWFEPRAVAQHHGRPGLGELLSRSYRQAYGTAREDETGTWRLLLASPVRAVVQTGRTLAGWTRAGVREPLLLLPALAATGLAQAAGTMAGALHRGRAPRSPRSPR